MSRGRTGALFATEEGGSLYFIFKAAVARERRREGNSFLGRFSAHSESPGQLIISSSGL